MRKPLKNPELPPGAIVETYEDGGARRNDGVTLTPASKNPWYVLATVAGEQDGAPLFLFDADLHAKNRRFWNAWMCQDLCNDTRRELEKELNLKLGDLSPLTESEQAAIGEAFERAFKCNRHLAIQKIPRPSDTVCFEKTIYTKPVAFDQFVFLSTVNAQNSNFCEVVQIAKMYLDLQLDFDGAHFERAVSLHSTKIRSHAGFVGSHFSEDLILEQVCFCDAVSFENCEFLGLVKAEAGRFLGTADFRSGKFGDVVEFKNAEFNGIAWFDDAIFEHFLTFDGAIFSRSAIFENASFRLSVPFFGEATIPNDVWFTVDPAFWPIEPSGDEIFNKRQYNRLRKISAEIYDPDLEHFFLRQEMKCKEALAGRFEKGLFVLYRWISDSGISVARPAAALAVLWALGAAMFAGYFLAPMGHDVPDTVAASPGWSGIGLSFANVLAFLGLSRAFFAEVLAALPISLKYFAGLQTILGAVFFFLLALGLRNRFRLK